MRREIKQNGKSRLWSHDDVTIGIIFRNLTGQNFNGREYADYIRYVAVRDMGFDYGKIEYIENGRIVETGMIREIITK